MRFTRAYYIIVLIVVLAHAGVLWKAGSPSLRMPRGDRNGRAMTMRVLVPLGESGSGPDRQASLPVPSGSPVAAPHLEGPAAARSSDAAGQLEQPQQPEAAVASPGAQPKGLPSADDSGEAAFADYLPRNRLSAPAQPLTSIEVPFPAGDPGLVDLRVQATLFIDEDGTVRRARVDSPDVPREFIQSVLQTFLPARFKPGEVQTVAVRSQLRIEVEFRATR